MSQSTQRAPDGADPQWHVLEVGEVATRLAVDRVAGLAAGEAAARLAAHGPNALAQGETRSPLTLLLRQFTDFMIGVLVAAGIVSALIGDIEDAIAIALIILLNAVIGFVQEFRAERALAALRRLAIARARVVRDGASQTVDATELVPGDVVLLEAGNAVPADLRLDEVAQLLADESVLTGESAAVAKTASVLDDPQADVAERGNLLFKGSSVVSGRGRGLVVATGMRTELGRVAAMLDTDLARRTPLQRRLEVFGRRIALVVVALCAVIFAAGLLRGEPLALMGMTAVSLAVAAIPEALPAVVTILLALGAHRMARERALVRRLPAVETLGSITHICADKTGTLTLNRMRVERMHAAGRTVDEWAALAQAEPWRSLLTACVLNNDARLAPERIGDPTELALLEAAASAGFDQARLEAQLPRRDELPFSAERKRMTTVHECADGAGVVYVKGAPENVLPRCSSVLGAEGPVPLDMRALEQAVGALAADGLRVLAFAKSLGARPLVASSPDETERALCLLGLVGLLDPPRDEAAGAVRQCREAGIVPVMITGDHPVTARAIAQRLGLIGKEARIVTGRELRELDDRALDELVAGCRVYARVDPAQKIRLVERLQAAGYFVAMTGDGVNDAPALNRADIGVAMGKGGTDVAREASSLVLLDDNFATIVSAVREGRRIYDNIRKFVRYAMTGNSAEILTIFLAPLVGLPIPLLPIHILWVNLVTDGLPGLALAAEPSEPGSMSRPPRPPRESLFAHGVWQHIAWVGLLIAGLCLSLQAWAWHGGSPRGQTMVFTLLTLAQMAHVLAIRGERVSLFRQGLGSNLPLLGAVLLTFALQLALIYVPALNLVFDTEPLTLLELGVCVGLATVPFLAVEAEKRWVRW
jgi:Ca2+-transporting ATPase